MDVAEYIVIKTWLANLISVLQEEYMLACENYMEGWHGALGRRKEEIECLLNGLDDIMLGLASEYARTGGTQQAADNFMLLADHDTKDRLAALTDYRIYLREAQPYMPVERITLEDLEDK